MFLLASAATGRKERTILRKRKLARTASALVIATAVLFVSAPGFAWDGTGTVHGTVRVTGSEGSVIGPFYLLVVPATEAARTIPEEEFKAAAIVTDDRCNFKKDGLAPGHYLVGVLLAPQVLEGEYPELIRVQTSQAADPISLPAVEVEVREAGTVRVNFVRKPNPTPPPGLKPPASGDAVLLESDGEGADHMLTLTGVALVALSLAGAAFGTAALKRNGNSAK